MELSWKSHGILFYSFRGNPDKGADQLCGYRKADLRLLFSPKHFVGFLMQWLIYFTRTCIYFRDLVERQCIDVTIPLQALIKDSKLISPDKNSKVCYYKNITLLVERQCIAVTIPLRALIKDSKLISPDKNSKVC